jgi:hypothetical protein
MNGRNALVRGAAFVMLLAVAASAGLVVSVVGALVIHQGLLLTVGEEGIPAIDGSVVMVGLLLADYVIAIVAGFLVFALGWIRVTRWKG